jgi:integrase/recombinase XerD
MGTLNGKGQAAVLSGDQIESILRLAGDRYRAIFAVAAFTGCRISEARKLKGAHVDLAGDTLTFVETKTGDDRTVPMSAKLKTILLESGAQLVGDSDWLFPSPRTAGPVTREAVGAELKAVAAELGYIGVSTHSFRRSVATTLSDKGAALKVIAGLTGHKSLDQLSRYIEVTPAQLAAAAALL